MENEENPTAAILMRFASKNNVNVSEMKHKQIQARHEIVSQAKRLTSAVDKEVKKVKQLDSARKARRTKDGE
jgi:hypothetical protein